MQVFAFTVFFCRDSQRKKNVNIKPPAAFLYSIDLCERKNFYNHNLNTIKLRKQYYPEC